MALARGPTQEQKRLLLLLLPLVLVLMPPASAALGSCPAQYRDVEPGSDEQPLLFGGQWDRCTSGCQPRDSMWSQEVCRSDPDALATINICERWQRNAIQGVIKQVSGGALMRFSPCDLFPYLQNRTLWIVGDSHTKGFYNALRCLTMDFWDHSLGECAASSNATLQLELELAALKGHIYNTPPRCLHMQGGGRVCLLHSPRGDLLVSNDTQSPGSLQVLQASFAAPQDVFYISFGRWHSNNCEGVSESFVPALEQVGEFLNATRQSFPNVVFALPPYDHSKCLNPLTRTFDESLPFCLTPAEAGYNQSIALQLALFAQDILHDKYGVAVIDSQSVSSQLYFGHVAARQSITGKTDCLHMCRPGMPEVDVFFFYQCLNSSNISRIDELLSSSISSYSCAFVQPALFKPAMTAGSSAPSSSPALVVTADPDSSNTTSSSSTGSSDSSTPSASPVPAVTGPDSSNSSSSSSGAGSATTAVFSVPDQLPHAAEPEAAAAAAEPNAAEPDAAAAAAAPHAAEPDAAAAAAEPHAAEPDAAAAAAAPHAAEPGAAAAAAAAAPHAAEPDAVAAAAAAPHAEPDAAAAAAASDPATGASLAAAADGVANMLNGAAEGTETAGTRAGGREFEDAAIKLSLHQALDVQMLPVQLLAGQTADTAIIQFRVKDVPAEPGAGISTAAGSNLV